MKAIHNELLLACEKKVTTGNKARTRIEFFIGPKIIGLTVLSFGEIILCHKYI